MKVLWFDTETYSEADLRRTGVHRYSEDLTTEIIIAQWALDDGEPVVEDLSGEVGGAAPSSQLAALLRDPEVLVVAHNSAFDRTLVRNVWGIDVPAERWLDTMVQALAHGLPGGLGALSLVLGLPDDQAKDKRGRELVVLFCKPRPHTVKLRRATRDTHPGEWLDFLEYARQDIVAMREVYRRLPRWNFTPGSPEHRLWVLDQEINDRGFLVDTLLAENAVALVTAETARIKAAVREATEGQVSGFNKPADLMKFISEQHGVSLPDMTADTLRRRMEDPDLPDGVRLLMSLRLEGGKASAAKYKALLGAVCHDGYLRGTLQFSGASRTARWSGRIFQPQNMPRPTMEQEDIDMGVRALHTNTADLVYGDAMDVASNTVRACIVAPQGRKLVVSDLSNIEGRMLAWLAGETWKLKAFREFDAGVGPDLYVAAYARALDVPVSAVGKLQRQIGKVLELALGYQGGVAAFLTFAAVYNLDLEVLADAVHQSAEPDALARGASMLEWVKSKGIKTHGLPDRIYIACEVLKSAWREAHPNVVDLWHAADTAARDAITHPGTVFHVGKHIRVRVDGNWLRARLPSGRYVCYLCPRIDTKDDKLTYLGQSVYSRNWSDLTTYGGKLVENWTQAAARDVLAFNMPRINERYPIVLTVHDEILTEVPDLPEFNDEELSGLLATNPPWAPGLPLAAKGFTTTRYRKD